MNEDATGAVTVRRSGRGENQKKQSPNVERTEMIKGEKTGPLFSGYMPKKQPARGQRGMGRVEKKKNSQGKSLRRTGESHLRENDFTEDRARRGGESL